MIATTPQTAAAQAPQRHVAAPDGARPAAGGGAGRPAPGGGPSAVVQLSPQAAARYAEAANSLDTADANEDGKISVKEQQTYDTQWVAKQSVRWAAQQREASQALPRAYSEQATARYGALQALAA